MELDFILTVLLSALSSAAMLVVASLGLAIVFGLAGVINLAHGEFIMLGAYASLFSTRVGAPYWLSVFIATSTVAVFGAVVERVVIRPLYGRILDTMLATWGLSLVIYQSAVIAFGSVTPGMNLKIPTMQIGAYGVSSYSILLILVAVVLIAAVYVLLTRTCYGILARASIQDPPMAAAIGIDSGLVNTATFALGAGLAGFAGAILLPLSPATPGMGFSYAVKSFLAVVAAGPLAISGTFVAAGSLGSTTNVVSSIWTAVVGDIFFFAVTITLLCLFPGGISRRWKRKL